MAVQRPQDAADCSSPGASIPYILHKLEGALKREGELLTALTLQKARSDAHVSTFYWDQLKELQWELKRLNNQWINALFRKEKNV